jgi:hypothetical protein
MVTAAQDARKATGDMSQEGAKIEGTTITLEEHFVSPDLLPGQAGISLNNSAAGALAVDARVATSDGLHAVGRGTHHHG